VFKKVQTDVQRLLKHPWTPSTRQCTSFIDDHWSTFHYSLTNTQKINSGRTGFMAFTSSSAAYCQTHVMILAPAYTR
jgi:hypothetical protein